MTYYCTAGIGRVEDAYGKKIVKKKKLYKNQEYII